MSLSDAEVKKIARLARLKMSDQERQDLVPKLNGIMDWIDTLSELDTESVDLHAGHDKPLMFERDDVINDGNKVAEILKNAPDNAHNMFGVRKVIE